MIAFGKHIEPKPPVFVWHFQEPVLFPNFTCEKSLSHSISLLKGYENKKSPTIKTAGPLRRNLKSDYEK
jgi:hypothetical protein